MLNKAQLMKGLLEGCILKIISKDTTYGYEIVTTLNEMGLDSKEGTIYPLLLRLEQHGLLATEYRCSPLGPKRKYYTINEKGAGYLSEFTDAWREVSQIVDFLFEEP